MSWAVWTIVRAEVHVAQVHVLVHVVQCAWSPETCPSEWAVWTMVRANVHVHVHVLVLVLVHVLVHVHVCVYIYIYPFLMPIIALSAR